MAEQKGFVPHQEVQDAHYEKGEKFVLTFDDAVEAVLGAPDLILGTTTSKITKTGRGKFRWNHFNFKVELSITPDDIKISHAEQNWTDTAEEAWINVAKEAQTFANSVEALWGNLPVEARTKENLKACAIANALEKYRGYEIVGGIERAIVKPKLTVLDKGRKTKIPYIK